MLIPYFGILGAAAATLIAYLIAFGLTIYYSLKFSKFDLEIDFIFKSIIASILMSLIIVFVNPIGIVNLLILILISSIFYFTLIIAFKGIKKEEILFFKRGIRYLVNN